MCSFKHKIHQKSFFGLGSAIRIPLDSSQRQWQ